MGRELVREANRMTYDTPVCLRSLCQLSCSAGIQRRWPGTTIRPLDATAVHQARLPACIEMNRDLRPGPAQYELLYVHPMAGLKESD